jgi:hypothetical protein
MNSQASSAIENGLTPPVDEQGHAHAAPMLLDLGERREVDLHQHRDNHQPDQHRHRQIDLGHLQASDHLERHRQQVAESDADDDAQRHPNRQIALESAERRPADNGGAGGGHRGGLSCGHGCFPRP